MRAIASMYIATLTNGTDNIRLSSTDVRQKQEIEYYGDPKNNNYRIGPLYIDGPVGFPLVTSGESILPAFYANMANNYNVSNWVLSYVDPAIKYTVKKVNSLSVMIETADCIHVSAHITCEKNVDITAKKNDSPNILSPARVYTWNDASATLYENDKVVVPTEWIRSASIKFEDAGDVIKASGTLVKLGESRLVVDPQKKYSIEIGYEIKRGVFSNKVNMRVHNLKILETPGFNDTTGSIYEAEKVNGVEVYREVKTESEVGILCTKFDWQAVINKG